MAEYKDNDKGNGGDDFSMGKTQTREDYMYGLLVKERQTQGFLRSNNSRLNLES